MRRSFYLYLFIFTALVALILYVNARNMQQSQDKAYITLEEKLEKTERQLEQARLNSTAVAQPFSLSNNEKATPYVTSTGLTSDQITSLLMKELLEQNDVDGGNPLVDFKGEGSGYQINEMQVLNHKWLIANFTDNQTWGEVLIQYDLDANNNLSLQTLKTVLYN